MLSFDGQRSSYTKHTVAQAGQNLFSASMETLECMKCSETFSCKAALRMHEHSGCILSPRAANRAQPTPADGALAQSLVPPPETESKQSEEFAAAPANADISSNISSSSSSEESEEIEYDNAMERQLGTEQKKARAVAKAARKAGEKCRRLGGTPSEVTVASARAALAASRKWGT